ncbi:MAG TPA: hypothetical protein EYO20_04130 [Gemmatimonadetes bacterium]|nr:hypothetical protein [Gemmatimonadota bacterium]HIA72941.1 hypothetical protein [Gemmatimonadota bacterium]HIB09021.1 hypothetical protein [Gemmatimonadota bacterium]
MNHASRSDQGDVKVAREVAARAILRLNLLEWVILGGAGLIAILGGWLVSWLIAPQLKVSFRSTWMGLSMLLFAVPGLIAIFRLRRETSVSKVATKLKIEERDG